jgi:hypothetical protein
LLSTHKDEHMEREHDLDRMSLAVVLGIDALPQPSELPGGQTQRNAMAQLIIRDALSKLNRELEVAEMCRSFWYTQYASASVKSAEAIDKVIRDAIAVDFESDPECAKRLKKTQAKITSAVQAYYIMQGSKVGATSIPGSLMAIVA